MENSIGHSPLGVQHYAPRVYPKISNRNPLLPTKEDEKMDGVIYGAYLPNLEKSVIPIGTASESTEPVNR